MVRTDLGGISQKRRYISQIRRYLPKKEVKLLFWDVGPPLGTHLFIKLKAHAAAPVLRLQRHLGANLKSEHVLANVDCGLITL
jgi:hypothetical protein